MMLRTRPCNTRLAHWMAACAIGAVLTLALPATAAAQGDQELETRLIKVTNVSLDGAREVALSVCRNLPQEPGGSEICRNVSRLSAENMLAVTATPPVIARIESLLAEFDRLPATRTFQIIVLAADRSGAGSDSVPENARQALQDIQSFLPYNSFNVIGSGWIRTSEYGETTLPGPQTLSAEIRFRPNTDPMAPVLIEQFSVYKRAVETVVEQGISTQQWRNRPILQSTFTIEPGETFVVGTSKLNGDDTAMVVLLTAVQN